MYPPMQQPQQPPKKRRLPWWLWVIIVIVAISVCGGISGAFNTPNSTTTTSSSSQTNTAPTHVATSASTAKPTTAPAVHYPPTTLADLRALAAKGDASAIYEFHSETTGLVGACPQPKREVTVDPSITGQQFAEDLLAYFFSQQLDSPCGALILAYHNQSEANDTYTAGRINTDVTTADGSTNFDPNGTGLKHRLTLDVGDLTTGQEYTVTYSH